MQGAVAVLQVIERDEDGTPRLRLVDLIAGAASQTAAASEARRTGKLAADADAVTANVPRHLSAVDLPREQPAYQAPTGNGAESKAGDGKLAQLRRLRGAPCGAPSPGGRADGHRHPRRRHRRHLRIAQGRQVLVPTHLSRGGLLARDGKIRKTFETLAEAKQWRADATVALNRAGRASRPPSPSSRPLGSSWRAPRRGGSRHATVANIARRRCAAMSVTWRAASSRRGRQLRSRVTCAALTCRSWRTSRWSVFAASTVQNVSDPLRAIFRRVA